MDDSRTVVNLIAKSARVGGDRGKIQALVDHWPWNATSWL
jgi:hypothetical protein